MPRRESNKNFDDWFKQSGEWFHENSARESMYLAWLMLSGAGVSPIVAGAAMNAVVSGVRSEYGE